MGVEVMAVASSWRPPLDWTLGGLGLVVIELVMGAVHRLELKQNLRYGADDAADCASSLSSAAAKFSLRTPFGVLPSTQSRPRILNPLRHLGSGRSLAESPPSRL